MNWSVDRLHESGASSEWCSLECDIQKGIVGADTLVKREREVKGDSRAF